MHSSFQNQSEEHLDYTKQIINNSLIYEQFGKTILLATNREDGARKMGLKPFMRIDWESLSLINLFFN